MTMPIDLILVRHGESEGNAANKASRRGDHSRFNNSHFMSRHSSHWRLTNHGQEQARVAGQWIKSNLQGPQFFDRYYTSTYVRARETAGNLGILGAEWYYSAELRERDWGDLDRMPDYERRLRFSQTLRLREEEIFLWRPPGGNSLIGVQSRIRDFLGTLHRECGDRKVIAVAHAEVLFVLRACLERMSPESFRCAWDDPEQEIRNCSIVHYTRRDPESGVLSNHLDWVRMMTPYDLQGRGNFGWRKFIRPRFTNEQLLGEITERYPQIYSE